MRTTTVKVRRNKGQDEYTPHNSHSAGSQQKVTTRERRNQSSHTMDYGHGQTNWASTALNGHNTQKKNEQK